MYCYGAVEGVMDCAASDVRSGHVTTQVEMNWVATWNVKVIHILKMF